MKKYVKPILETIDLRAEESIALCGSGAETCIKVGQCFGGKDFWWGPGPGGSSSRP